jgi:cytochrome c-type biogenesis protein CcmH
VTAFVLAAVALAAITVLLLVVPLARRRVAARGATQAEVSVAVLKDQLAELERDLASGNIGREAYEAAQKEVKARLLEDAAPEAAPAERPSLAPPLALAILLPACAVGLYVLLGNPAALDPQQRAAGPSAGAPDAAQIEGMVARLAKKMEASPDDPQGWLMLARSYRVLGRNADAARAYGKAEAAVAADPKLLTDYAEALALTHDGSLQGRPTELLERALQLDPAHAMARMLLGAAYFQRGEWARAIGEWEKARARVAPDSADARVLDESIARAREHAKGAAGTQKPGAEK